MFDKMSYIRVVSQMNAVLGSSRLKGGKVMSISNFQHPRMRPLAAGVLAVLTSVPAGAALAQDTGGTLEEVIVFAQKRSENLNDVPLAVSVVSGNLLGSTATVSTESLVNLVPSLTFRKGTTNVNSSFNLRGVGTISFSSGVEPSVSTVLDGVVLARSGMAFNDLLDIDRVEVLRGPQGTLFGKNSSAGVVQIITADPTEAFEGYAEVSGTDDEEYRARGVLSGPLSATVRARLGVSYGEYDGNIGNVFNGDDVNGYERYGVRGKLVWDASETVTVRLTGDYMKADDDCCADVIGFVDPAQARNTRVLLPSIAPVNPGDENRQIDNDLLPRTEDESWGLSAQIDWTIGEHTLTSISAVRGWENTEVRDGDFRSDTTRWVNGSVPAGDTTLHDNGTLDFQQVTQELRIASPTDGFVEYVAGLFYYSTDQDNVFTRTIRQCTASALPPEPSGNVPCNAASTFVQHSGTATFNTKLDNYAAFGNLTFNLTDSFRLLTGARYTNDDLEYTFSRVSTSATAQPGIQPAFSSAAALAPPSVDEDDISYRAGLQYDLSDDVMAYATYTDGYKGPAFNIFFNMNANNTLPIAEEDVKASEVGLKSTVLDGRLIMNLAVFHAEYEGFHANSFVQVAGTTVSTLTNAGDVRTEGAELDIMLQPTEDFTLIGGVAYTEAEITKANCAPGAAASCALRKGKQLAFSPDLKASLSADWRLPLGETLPFDVHLTTAYTYQSDVNYDLDRNPLAAEDAYGLWDAGIAFADRNDRYKLSLLAKNLADEKYTTLKVVEGGAFVRNQIARDADRYFSLALRVNFGN